MGEGCNTGNLSKDMGTIEETIPEGQAGEELLILPTNFSL